MGVSFLHSFCAGDRRGLTLGVRGEAADIYSADQAGDAEWRGLAPGPAGKNTWLRLASYVTVVRTRLPGRVDMTNVLDLISAV